MSRKHTNGVNEETQGQHNGQSQTRVVFTSTADASGHSV